jgi:hypothetical protein
MDFAATSSESTSAPHEADFSMRACMGSACGRGLRMAGTAVRQLWEPEVKHPVKRGGWLLFALPLSGLLFGLNWIGLWLDELLYPQVRRKKLISPVFVLGPPRSGTTHLHRVLAADRERFSTSATWEVLLAPSIVQKKLFRFLGKMDRKVGGPLMRLVGWCERKLLGGFAETHPSSLFAPEEDYFYLTSLMACSGLLLAFPGTAGLKRYLPGTEEDSVADRRQALLFYRYCVQKQLAAAGGHHTLLSKNASFSSWMDVLPEVFPDARFVVCMRGPTEAVPSMLSMASQAVTDFQAGGLEASLKTDLVSSMQAHYQTLHEVVPRIPVKRMAVVQLRELNEALEPTVKKLGERFGLNWNDSFLDFLNRESEKSKAYRSAHHYDLDAFGLDAEELRKSCPVTASSFAGCSTAENGETI